MKHRCLDAQTNIFARSVSVRFKSFEDKIKKMANANNIEFCEDVFMDTVVKCMDTFPTMEPKESDIDNYFWVAFKQNSISATTRNKFRNAIDIDDADDIEDVQYNEDIDTIADVINDAIKSEFGEELYRAWNLHVCENYTYTDLNDCGYGHLNLHNAFKKIKRYVHNKVIAKNVDLKIMLEVNNFDV